MCINDCRQMCDDPLPNVYTLFGLLLNVVTCRGHWGLQIGYCRSTGHCNCLANIDVNKTY